MKKRTAQLWGYGIYCLLSLVGILLDFELIGGRFSTRPFVFYTSLSNMLCSGFMLFSLVNCIRHSDNNCDFAPLWKFMFTVMILLTAIVYNLLLNPYRSWIAYFASVKNSLYHLILPLMFLLDWLIFYRRGSVKVLYPLYALIIPLIYVVYILVRATVVKAVGISVNVLYPYFFLNVARLGWDGFAMWMMILLVSLIALGYVLFALDRLFCRKTKENPCYFSDRPV